LPDTDLDRLELCLGTEPLNPRAIDGTIVAFEADDFDTPRQWWVHTLGVAHPRSPG
jgi:hypothetical protein